MRAGAARTFDAMASAYSTEFSADADLIFHQLLHPSRKLYYI
jgi:hypothetical protein